MPFALAAKAVNPLKPVVAIVGDSSFGFSAMVIFYLKNLIYLKL